LCPQDRPSKIRSHHGGARGKGGWAIRWAQDLSLFLIRSTSKPWGAAVIVICSQRFLRLRSRPRWACRLGHAGTPRVPRRWRIASHILLASQVRGNKVGSDALGRKLGDGCIATQKCDARLVCTAGVCSRCVQSVQCQARGTEETCSHAAVGASMECGHKTLLPVDHADRSRTHPPHCSRTSHAPVILLALSAGQCWSWHFSQLQLLCLLASEEGRFLCL